MAVNGGAKSTSRSLGKLATRGRKALANAWASAQVMCIFQLPAITDLPTAFPSDEIPT
jgi:hypothetical protein